MLIAPLPEIGDRSLVIVPTGSLHRLPWTLLASCRGRPVTVNPTASTWYNAMTRTRPGGHAVVAAGPTLPGARDEALAVAALHHVEPLVDDAATAAAVTERLDGAAIAHIAAHGHVRADNPQFGSLKLNDGPLMIYDLERLHRAPHTLVLAACDAGTSIGSVGDELLGLTVALLALGSAQLIAPLLPILDAETAPIMTALHTALRAGQPPASALATAQQEHPRHDPGSITTAVLVCFGAGYLSYDATATDTGLPAGLVSPNLDRARTRPT